MTPTETPGQRFFRAVFPKEVAAAATPNRAERRAAEQKRKRQQRKGQRAYDRSVGRPD